MQHLHGASSRSRFPVPVLCFLILWSVTAVPVPKKAHGSTTACQRLPVGGSGRMDATRGNSDTLVSSLEDMGLPHFGTRSHLLFSAETPRFLAQDDTQALSGEAEGMFQCRLGHPGWVARSGGGRGLWP